MFSFSRKTSCETVVNLANEELLGVFVCDYRIEGGVCFGDFWD